MIYKTTFLRCLEVALFTIIFSSFVNICNMSCKTTFLSCPEVTLFTIIFNSIMNRCHMLIKITFIECTVATLFTVIFNPFVNRFHFWEQISQVAEDYFIWLYCSHTVHSNILVFHEQIPHVKG